ncbi:DUF6083 domain-containing protein [Streptomyces luteireticuli]|uniref:Uncharacterized protein n=1 Tax=Streptomyces luteireticuli TaxID=173858 RepID=A0ABN0Z953_9ACTN
MHATPPTQAAARARDGSPGNYRTPRSLRVAPDSPTRLLRAAQPGTCTACGNHIEWYSRPKDRTIPLHPHELPTTTVPPHHRWHVSSGLAHPGGDGTPWCRVRHHAICPATTDTNTPGPLGTLRRALALRTRRLTDTGAFTPPTNPTDPAGLHTPGPPEPARPAIRLLHLRYLAPSPLDHITCVARTRTRHRCPHPVLDPAAPPGTWTLIPLHPGHDDGQLPLTDDQYMAVYDLTHLPYAEQLRWRAQRCTAHAATPAAADTALAAWEPFNPRTHHHLIQHHLPQPPHHTPHTRQTEQTGW